MKQELTEAVIVKQMVAGSSIVLSVFNILPIIIGIPAALYYCVLIIEKITGKPFSELVLAFIRKIK